MTYASCETALITVLKLLTSTFTTSDVTAGDYRVLDNNSVSHAIVVAGSVGDNGVTGYVQHRTWDLLIDLYCRAVDDTMYTTFAALRDTVIAHLDKYPTLNHTSGIVVQKLVSDGDPVDVMDKQGGGPYFVTQRLRMTVEERISLSSGEYT